MADDEPSSGATGLPEALIEGYEAFISGRFLADHDRFEELAVRGQTPKTMIISCCDSRVAPGSYLQRRPRRAFRAAKRRGAGAAL